MTEDTRRVHISMPTVTWDLLGHEAIRRRTSRSGLLRALAASELEKIRSREHGQQLVNPGNDA